MATVVVGSLAGEGIEQTSGLTGIDIRPPSAHASTIVIRCPYDQVSIAVVVHIPGPGNRVTEHVACCLTGEGPEHTAGLTGIDIRPPSAHASTIVIRCPHDQVSITIVVYVPGSGNRVTKVVVCCLAGESPVQMHVPADIRLPGIVASLIITGCPYDHVSRPIVVHVPGPGDRIAEEVVIRVAAISGNHLPGTLAPACCRCGNPGSQANCEK